jgi:16S rRNA (cytidine1402-2'-O)-methyltransferase
MLYIVSTPIGNLKDITFRAIETLNQVDIIACEDTRKSLILLNKYNIKKQLISYHKFTEQKSSEQIISLLQQGKDVALISDSGTPLISDPGYILIEKLKSKGLEYTIIPGANAAVSALVLSGFDTTSFVFVGFLPEKNKDKIKIIENIKALEFSLIFYISPHNLEKDVEFLYKNLGGRKACFVKEITKIYETIYDFTLGQELDINSKGEFVLIVEGCKKDISQSLDFNKDNLKEIFDELVNQGLSEKDAMKKISEDFKVKKQDVYKMLKVK